MRDPRGRIYLDYFASTPVDPRVADLVREHMLTSFGNAGSADHVFGDEAAEAVDSAASELALLAGASKEDVVFTSGATESINTVLRGVRAKSLGRPLRIAVSPTEHSAVLQTCAAMARSGAVDIRWLNVDARGRIDVDEISAVCSSGIDLVSVMAANNEIGTVAPAETIAEIAQQHGVGYLCDASQACGRVPLKRLAALGGFVIMSAHKMYGPKGIGAIVSSHLGLLQPLMYGGDQQHGRRAGTLNVPGIAGFGCAARLRREEMALDEPRIAILRDAMQTKLQNAFPGIVVNGDQQARLSGSLHVSVRGIPNSAVIARIRERLAIATGAACSSGIEAPSHVLRAIGMPGQLSDGALRISLGKWTTSDDVETACEILREALAELERYFR